MIFLKVPRMLMGSAQRTLTAWPYDIIANSATCRLCGAKFVQTPNRSGIDVLRRPIEVSKPQS